MNYRLLILLSLFFISCNNYQEIEGISTVELKSLLDKEKIQLLDVRTKEETKQGYIKTAVFADFFNQNFPVIAEQKLDKTKPVYLYCRSGNRSGKAAIILKEKGFKVYNIVGGFNKWKLENK